jgi:hypothetical protein
MALLVCPRYFPGIDGAAEESIDEAAEVKQIVRCANKLRTMGRDRVGLEVRPFGGNQRLASVRQNQNELQSVLPMRMAQDFQRLSFERVVWTGDGHPLGEVLRVGSVSWFPWIT